MNDIITNEWSFHATGTAAIIQWTSGQSLCPYSTNYCWEGNCPLKTASWTLTTDSQSTIGYTNVKLTWFMSMKGKTGNDHCYIEYMTDKITWRTVVHLNHDSSGQTDTFSSWIGQSANNNSDIRIRLRSNTDNGGISCYYNELKLTGDPIPKGNPTENMVNIKTKNPSIYPTNNPRNYQTTYYTQYPSHSIYLPSINPTLYPTEDPSPEPTPNPTRIPTTNEPTTIPTEYPMPEPTPNPTRQPTVYESTYTPTDIPTVNPTTISPTNHPSTYPITTVYPTKYPSNNPFILTLSDPTIDPTLQPTIHPLYKKKKKKYTTVFPTSNPTMNPTQVSMNSTVVSVMEKQFEINEYIILYSIGLFVFVIIISSILSFVCMKKKFTQNNKKILQAEFAKLEQLMQKNGYQITNANIADDTPNDTPEHKQLINERCQSHNIEIKEIKASIDDEISDDEFEDMYVNANHRDTLDMDDTQITVEKWLYSIVKLPQYYNIFMKNGFDSLELIIEINKIEHLDYIGITNKAHQIKLMNHIQKLRYHDMNFNVGETGE